MILKSYSQYKLMIFDIGTAVVKKNLRLQALYLYIGTCVVSKILTFARAVPNRQSAGSKSDK